MIKPEIGMPVLFVDYNQYIRPATIVFVYPGSGSCVRLITVEGETKDSVLLHQGFDGQPNPMGGYWCQFPNWFLRILAPQPIFTNIPELSVEELMKLPIGPMQIVRQPFVTGVAVVPPGSFDSVRCEKSSDECVDTPTWAKTSQVQG